MIVLIKDATATGESAGTTVISGKDYLKAVYIMTLIEFM